jgi:hypothetical protein
MKLFDLGKLGEDTCARLRAWKPGIHIFSVLSEADIERIGDDECISPEMLYQLAAALKKKERSAQKCKKRYWANPDKWRKKSIKRWRKKATEKNHEQLNIAKNTIGG